MSFSAFATGFLGALDEKIENRQARADAYFDERFKHASTQGRKRLQEMKAAHKQAQDLARSLMDKGVPTDIITAAANNPEDLATVYEFWEQNANKGIEIGEEDWRRTFDIVGEISDENTSPFTVLKEAYSPYKQNLEVDPESIKQDVPGGLFASIMGYNAMEKASKRVEGTEVIDGLTVGDVESMDGPRNPLGDVRLSYDPTGFVKDSKGSNISDSMYNSAVSNFRAFATRYEEVARDEVTEEIGRGEFENLSIAEQRAMVEQRAQELAAASVYELYPEIVPHIPGIAKYLTLSEDDTSPIEDESSIETTDLPPAGSEEIAEEAIKEIDSTPSKVEEGATIKYQGKNGVVDKQDSEFYYVTLEGGRKVKIPKKVSKRSGIMERRIDR